MDNYLIHFGNKNSGRYPRGSGENPHQHDGYKVRQSKKINDNYTLKQRKQDESLYGTRAANRINKKTANGEGILSARHHEVVRKQRKTKAKNTISKSAKVLAPVGAAVSVYLLNKNSDKIKNQKLRSASRAIKEGYVNKRGFY